MLAEPRSRSVVALPGTMMDVPLTIRWIFEHVLRNNAARDVTSRDVDGELFRYT
jgi:hypothetical protein